MIQHGLALYAFFFNKSNIEGTDSSKMCIRIGYANLTSEGVYIYNVKNILKCSFSEFDCPEVTLCN